MNNTNVVETTTAPAVTPQPAKKTSANSVLARMAEHFGVSPKGLYTTLAKTCFRKPDGSAPTNEEMMSLLIISEKAGLNPMLGQIYAFPGKNGGIVPIVGVNGLREIATANPEYSGVRFEYSERVVSVAGVECNESIRCFVKRRRPDGYVFESEGIAFFTEKFRPTEPWKNQPRHMLSNKALIQALKNTFPALSSLYDEDEGWKAAGMQEQTAAPATQPVGPWDRKDLTGKLTKLVALAKARGQWAVAGQWVMEKTQGADQEFALEFISKARAETVTDVHVVEPKQVAAPAPDLEGDTPF